MINLKLMSLLLGVSVAVLVSVSAIAEENNTLTKKEKKDGWKLLFDGKTLNGGTQRNGKATYRVEDGAIVGRTAKSSPNSFLCTDKAYCDFDLRFEVQVDRGLNSGVQIRSRSSKDFNNERVHGPQVEIKVAPGESGYIYGEATGRGWLSQNRTIMDAYKNDQWNTYRVLARCAGSGA